MRPFTELLSVSEDERITEAEHEKWLESARNPQPIEENPPLMTPERFHLYTSVCRLQDESIELNDSLRAIRGARSDNEERLCAVVERLDWLERHG